MKKLMIAALCLMALTACTQKKNNPAEDALLQQRDSLTRVIEQKDNEIDDMVATMNDIQEGFRAINEAEQRVTIAKNGEGTTAAEGIRENMEFIQSQMQQNRELISKLRNQLRQSSVKADQLRRTLDNLTQQLDEKDNQLRQLQAELEAKDLQIGGSVRCLAMLAICRKRPVRSRRPSLRRTNSSIPHGLPMARRRN